jgi:hypothetical protein
VIPGCPLPHTAPAASREVTPRCMLMQPRTSFRTMLGSDSRRSNSIDKPYGRDERLITIRFKTH